MVPNLYQNGSNVVPSGALRIPKGCQNGAKGPGLADWFACVWFFGRLVAPSREFEWSQTSRHIGSTAFTPSHFDWWRSSPSSSPLSALAVLGAGGGFAPGLGGFVLWPLGLALRLGFGWGGVRLRVPSGPSVVVVFHQSNQIQLKVNLT